MNTLIPDLYDGDSFSYRNLIRAESLKLSESIPKLLHPVLAREDYDRKVSRITDESQNPPLAERIARVVLSRVNALRRW